MVEERKDIDWFILILITFFTGGLWFLVYGVYYLFFKTPYCPICGSKDLQDSNRQKQDNEQALEVDEAAKAPVSNSLNSDIGSTTTGSEPLQPTSQFAEPIAVQPAKQAAPLLDINTASVEELKTIPGINLITAKKIISIRYEIGEFDSVDDLLKRINLSPHIAANLQTRCCAKHGAMEPESRLDSTRIIDI